MGSVHPGEQTGGVADRSGPALRLAHPLPANFLLNPKLEKGSGLGDGPAETPAPRPV